MINILTDVFPTLNLKVQEWKSWLIFFVDERLVPFDDPQSTFGCYVTQLLPRCPSLSVESFVPIDPSLDAESCASDYELRIKSLLDVNPETSFPSLDLVLLGFGPDGHTASLFPGHALLQERRKWVASITDSPKPPPTRVTLTFPIIEAAKNIAVVSTGSSKAEIVKKVFVDEDQTLPINMVKSPVKWLIDSEAASLLNN